MSRPGFVKILMRRISISALFGAMAAINAAGALAGVLGTSTEDVDAREKSS